MAGDSLYLLQETLDTYLRIITNQNYFMSTKTRIVSLIPAATEILYLLGLEENIVGRSHDSDYPLDVKKKKIISTPNIKQNLSSLEIDKAVKNLIHQGSSVFHIDQKKLNRLKPDLILTQELCPVCAPTFTEVKQAARIMQHKTRVVSLEPHTLSDVFDNIALVAKEAGIADRARSVIERLKYRLENIPPRHKNIRKPTVVVIEWLNPLMVSGHWINDMVKIAGGNILLSQSGKKSRYVDWYEIVNADPEFIILAPCGFDIARAKKEIYLFKHRTGWDKLKAVKKKQIYYMDGDAYLTRSGPRLVDGAEILAKVFHPTWFGYPHPHDAEQVI